MLFDPVGVRTFTKFEEGIKEIETRTLPAFAGHKEGLTYGKVFVHDQNAIEERVNGHF